MRMGMMLGTCINIRENTLVIDSPNAPQLWMLNLMSGPNLLMCSLALTKMTKIMY
jgi:hypothetical protein